MSKDIHDLSTKVENILLDRTCDNCERDCSIPDNTCKRWKLQEYSGVWSAYTPRNKKDRKKWPKLIKKLK